MRPRMFLLASVTLLGLTSLFAHSSMALQGPQAAPAKLTVLLYMNGKNDLATDIQKNISEIQEATALMNVSSGPNDMWSF